MNGRRAPIKNKILIVLSILLCIILGCFLIWYRQTEKETTQRLREKEQSAAAAWKQEESEKTPGDETIPETENLADDTESQGDAAQEEDFGQQDGQDADNEDTVLGISFRGDSFGDEEDTEQNGVAARLADILKENNQDIDVQDYSMDVAGTLSQMRLAGVAQSELDAYLEKHTAEANGAELRITETKIRELSEEDLVRTDQAYIPVICMGYYGGWGNDLDELCEQQQKILDTYQQTDQYLILGVYPTGFSDQSAYEEKMASRWGEHYINVSSSITHTVSSTEGKKETARLIYDKLTELGYLS